MAAPFTRAPLLHTSTRIERVADPKLWTCLLLAVVIMMPATVAADGGQAAAPPEKLVAGGKILLKNDLQAWSDSMLLFRGFRREFRRLDQFETVDAEDEADLIAILSGDPNVTGDNEVINRGIPYPSGYGTSRMMILVIYDARTKDLLWLDALDWNTTGNITQVDSHEQLVRRLKAALDEAGQARGR